MDRAAGRSNVPAVPWCPDEGQIGRGGSSSGRGGSDEKPEAVKKRPDAARLHGSYRYAKYDLAPPLAFY
jgi:hypothetical protein